MAKKRAFVSFDFDNDPALKDFVIGQARLPDSPFEVNVVERGGARENVGGQSTRGDQALRYSPRDGRPEHTRHQVKGVRYLFTEVEQNHRGLRNYRGSIG